MMSSSNKDIDWSKIGYILLGLFGLYFVYNQLAMSSTMTVSGHMGRVVNTGGGANQLLFSLIGLAIKLLWFILLVSVLIGIYIAVKRYVLDNNSTFNLNLLSNSLPSGYNCPSCNESLSQEFKFCPRCKESLKKSCAKCGKDLLAGWKCCPCCGTENGQPA